MACVVGVGGVGLASSCVVTTKTKQRLGIVGIRAESMATEKLGIKIEKNPQESKLTQLGVRNWPK